MKTVEDAIAHIVEHMDEETKLQIHEADNLIQYHHGWGTGIRNGLGLWEEGNLIMESEGPMAHPDDVSMLIMNGVKKRIDEEI